MFEGSKLELIVLVFLFSVAILCVLLLSVFVGFMSEATFFNVFIFFLWVYALIGIVFLFYIAYGLCSEFCHV